MHGESIDKYLQPVADKIWALKDTLRVSIQPEAKPSDLSYQSMKTWKIPEWVENHYAWNDRDIVDENGDVVPNPNNLHIPNENMEVFEDEVNEWKKNEKKIEKADKKSDPEQLEIPFDFED